MKILLVDDEPDVLETIGLMLSSSLECTLTSVSSGALALEYLKLNPDLNIIISDINMEVINGFQLAKVVNEINPKIRIILISGFVSIIDQIKHFEMGIEKILTKPFNMNELVAIIANPPEKTDIPISNMVQVKIETLVETKYIPLDLYVKLTGEKFVKMFNANQVVDKERLKIFQAQDVHYLFAKKDDSYNLDLVLYVPARVSVLKSNRALNFNVFYQHDNEYKKLIPSGSLMTPEMLSVIKDRKIKVLYVVDKDQPLFFSYLEQTLEDYMNNKEIAVEDKLVASSTIVQARVQEVYRNPTQDNILTLKKSQKHLMDFLKVDNNSIKELIKINEADKGLHIHSSMVASLSYAMLLKIIAMREDKEDKLKIRALDEYIFESDDVKEIIFTGALLHDLGKPLSDVGIAEQENSGAHAKLAYDKLKDLDAIHHKSLEIILQHEEFCDGTGFPNRLKKTNISFFSQVVILVNYFDNLRRHSDMSVSDVLADINQNAGKFNKHLIPILERVVLTKKA